MTFIRLQFQRGKARTAKWYPGSAQATLTTPINRYNCGMTVGHGFYHVFSHTDPIGAKCCVLGWFDDGRVSVALPVGGCGVVGRVDVQITEWPEYATPDQRASWDALPLRSLVKDAEIQPE